MVGAQEQFAFQVKTEMYYGIGYSRNLGKFLQERGLARVGLLVDAGVAQKASYYQEVRDILAGHTKNLYIEELRGTEEPDYDYLDEVAAKIRQIEHLDVLIGIGGGSCLDVTKAVAVLRTNPGKGIDYRGFDQVVNPGVPTIAIPSTAGTGSEVTINAPFTDKREMRKLGINGRYLNATYAILDAEWTMSCPLFFAVSAGMDAMTHTLESFTCKQANRLTRIFSKEAFRLLFQALPALIDDPHNREKRQQILLGAYLAGIALFNSGSGIAGALSYPIGVHYKVPHGIGGGIFLASVIEYNVDRGYEDYAELLDLVEYRPELTPREKRLRFLEVFRALVDKLGVPTHLGQWGITRENLDAVAKLMLPMQAAFDQNPIPFAAETDALDMLRAHVI